MVIGVYKWPYAPIRQSPDGFVDKRGNKFTAEDYRWFKKWEISYLIIGSTGFLLAVILQFEKTRQKRLAKQINDLRTIPKNDEMQL